MANDKTTEWAAEILGDGADSARGAFVGREPRQGDTASDRLDRPALLDQEELEAADVDAGAAAEERQTVSPGKERGAADQQRTDDGHGYAGQGAPGQPGTCTR